MYLFSSVGGKMWLFLWRWVVEVLFTNLLPKRCGALMGSGGCWEPQFSGRSLRRETPPKLGEMLGIKGLECQE